jgi:hypothetical protein
MSVKKATNPAEVCRAAVLPSTSPALVLKAGRTATRCRDESIARASVGFSTHRRAPGRLQNPCFQFRGQHRGDLPPMPAVTSGDALLGKSSAPAGHKTAAAVDAFGHFIPGMAFGQKQDKPRPSGIFRPIPTAIGSPRQFHKLGIRQRDRVSQLDAIIVYI